MQRDLSSPTKTSPIEADIVRQPNGIDVHVGQRMRTRRKMLGMSQEQLATALALTFQQIQKYERGSNRVSASKLYEAATSLQVPVSYFFEGLADPGGEVGDPGIEVARLEVQRFLALSQGPKIVAQFPKLSSRARVQITALIGALAGETDPADGA